MSAGAAWSATSSRTTAGTPSAGSAPQRHLRPQRPGAGRADLPHRSAGLPQHADVLQRRDAVRGSCPGSTSRCGPTGSCSWARPRCCSTTPQLFDAGRPASGGSSARSPPYRHRRSGGRRPGYGPAGCRRSDDVLALKTEAFLRRPGRAARRRPTDGWSWSTTVPGRCSALTDARPGAAVPGPGSVLPAGRAAVAHGSVRNAADRGRGCATWSGTRPATETRRTSTSSSSRCSTPPGACSASAIMLQRRDAVPAVAGRARGHANRS